MLALLVQCLRSNPVRGESRHDRRRAVVWWWVMLAAVVLADTYGCATRAILSFRQYGGIVASLLLLESMVRDYAQVVYLVLVPLLFDRAMPTFFWRVRLLTVLALGSVAAVSVISFLGSWVEFQLPQINYVVRYRGSLLQPRIIVPLIGYGLATALLVVATKPPRRQNLAAVGVGIAAATCALLAVMGRSPYASWMQFKGNPVQFVFIWLITASDALAFLAAPILLLRFMLRHRDEQLDALLDAPDAAEASPTSPPTIPHESVALADRL